MRAYDAPPPAATEFSAARGAGQVWRCSVFVSLWRGWKRSSLPARIFAGIEPGDQGGLARNSFEASVRPRP